MLAANGIGFNGYYNKGQGGVSTMLTGNKMHPVDGHLVKSKRYMDLVSQANNRLAVGTPATVKFNAGVGEGHVEIGKNPAMLGRNSSNTRKSAQNLTPSLNHARKFSTGSYGHEGDETSNLSEKEKMQIDESDARRKAELRDAYSTNGKVLTRYELETETAKKVTDVTVNEWKLKMAQEKAKNTKKCK